MGKSAHRRVSSTGPHVAMAKNDVIKIIGNPFARSMAVVLHDNVEVAHTLLQDGTTRIILIKCVLEVAEGPLMIVVFSMLSWKGCYGCLRCGAGKDE